MSRRFYVFSLLIIVFQYGLTRADCVTVDFGDQEGVIESGQPAYEFFGDKDSSFASLARMAIEQAAADVSSMIDCSSLTAIAAANSTHTATVGTATVQVTGEYLYSDPYDGTSVAVPEIAAQTINVFVGGRILGGNTLGQGGTGIVSGGTVTGLTTSTTAAEVENALDAAASSADNYFRRGSAAPLTTLNYTASLPGTTPPQTASRPVNFGVAVGNLWFDFDTDNDGSGDDLSTLASNWHVDHTTPPASGKSDLYTVALHELLHAIGVPGHLPDDTASTTLSSGQSQMNAVMEEALLLGERRFLTMADRQFAINAGWQVTPVPEPNAALLLLLIAVISAGGRRMGGSVVEETQCI